MQLKHIYNLQRIKVKTLLLMSQCPTHTLSLFSPPTFLIQNKNCESVMKIQVSPTWLCHGLHSPPSSFSSSSLFFFFSSVRVLGVAVLSHQPVPTLTPSLTPGVTGRPLRSQLVTVSAEDGVACLAGCQLLERALWRTAGCFSARLLLREEIGFETNGQILPELPRKKATLLPPVTNLSRRAVRGVGPVVELSVKLTRVKVQNKLFQFARDTKNTETHVGHQPSFIQFEVCTVVPKKTNKNNP